MRIIALSTLKTLLEEHPEYMDAKVPAFAWCRHTLTTDWSIPADVKQDFRNASTLKESLPHEHFMHPEVDLSHPLCEHILYSLSTETWQKQQVKN